MEWFPGLELLHKHAEQVSVANIWENGSDACNHIKKFLRVHGFHQTDKTSPMNKWSSRFPSNPEKRRSNSDFKPWTGYQRGHSRSSPVMKASSRFLTSPRRVFTYLADSDTTLRRAGRTFKGKSQCLARPLFLTTSLLNSKSTAFNCTVRLVELSWYSTDPEPKPVSSSIR